MMSRQCPDTTFSCMTALGIAITLGNTLLLAVAFLLRRRFPLPFYGWIGLALLLSAEALMFRGIWPVTVYFTPLAWTAYILLVDAMVQVLTGRSRLHDEPQKLVLAA